MSCFPFSKRSVPTSICLSVPVPVPVPVFGDRGCSRSGPINGRQSIDQCLLQVVGEFDFVSAYNGSGVLTTVYTPVGKAEQVSNTYDHCRTGTVRTTCSACK